MKISIVGAGNVGAHLGKALFGAGHEIVQVFSQTSTRAKRLAEATRASYSTVLEYAMPANLYLLAVQDAFIDEVSNGLRDHIPVTSIVAHTAASVSIEALSGHTRHGVFYPLQTFTAGREIDLHDVPFLIAGNSESVIEALSGLGHQLSRQVSIASDQQRKFVHLAATIACNFSNHMYALAQQVMEAGDLDFALLQPLILETARKGTDLPPQEAQTGAAIRGDASTMQRHLELLTKLDMDDQIYRMISASIQQHGTDQSTS